jgi:hypothetical protein
MLDVTEQLRRYGDAATRDATPVGAAEPSMPTPHSRGPRRRRSLVGIAALCAVIVVVVGLLAAENGGDRTEVALNPRPVAVPPIEWTQVAMPPGAQGLQGVAGNGADLVAIGAVPTVTSRTIPSPDTATIWISTDMGQTWEAVFSMPPERDPARPSGSALLPTSLTKVRYVNDEFVVLGLRSVPDANGRATVWVSRDGRNWMQSNAAPFAPTTIKVAKSIKKFAFVGSRVADVTEWRGRLVVVGDLYTNNRRQCCGLSPAVWVSTDGAHWSRRVLDLGDGFDPYQTSVTTRGDTVIALGRAGKWPATQWTTRDLRDWHASSITDQGYASITKTGRGYIAAGTVSLPGASKDDNRPGRPTIWWSRDAHNWTTTLQLAPMKSGGFATAAAIDGLVIATGPSDDESRTSNKLYVSADGRSWRDTTPPGSLRALLLVVGSGSDWIYVTRGNEMWVATRSLP